MAAQILIEAARAVVADACEMNIRRLGYAIEQTEQPEPAWLTELVERARLLRRHHQDFGTCLVIAALAGFKDPSMVPQLADRARRDPDGDCRLAALELLSALGTEGAVAAANLRKEFRAEAPAGQGEALLEMVKREV